MTGTPMPHAAAGGGASPLPASGQAPTIVTERMVLRMPTLADAEPYMAVLMSERAIHMDGPMKRYDAWLDFCMEVANWPLRGYGPFAMEERKTGTFLGLMILHHDDGDPERELGWVLTPQAEGRGLAFEAAKAVRAWGFDTQGWSSIVSYIDPANSRSIALAEKLGARRDLNAEPVPSYPECLIYRHSNPETDR